MPKICDLSGVRGGDTGFPVQLYRDDDSNRIVVRGTNEGGFACVDIDLGDLLQAFGVPDSAEDIASALAIAEHLRGHESSD